MAFGTISVDEITSSNNISVTGNVSFTGNVTVGAGTVSNAAISTTGDPNTGIFFPAADNIGFATNGVIRGRWTTDGLCFNADTAAANALDDYEEGTWTPTDVSGAGLSFSTAVGIYTKIGRMVYASTQIIYPSTANGSSALIGGLPFTLPSTNVVRQGFISYVNASVVARALPEDGQPRFDIRKTDGTNVTNSELSGKTLFAMLIYSV